MAFDLNKNDGSTKSKFDLSKSDDSTPDVQEPKKSNNTTIIIVVVLAVIAFAVYLFTKDSSFSKALPIAILTPSFLLKPSCSEHRATPRE